MLTKRTMMATFGAAAIALSTAQTASAASHAFEPTKPIDFVIMAGAGGGADQIARFIQSVAEKMDLTTRPLVPNNKGGGSGAEALIALNGASDPDHTILVTLNSFFASDICNSWCVPWTGWTGALVNRSGSISLWDHYHLVSLKVQSGDLAFIPPSICTPGVYFH